MPKNTKSPEDKRLQSIFNALLPVADFPVHTQLYILHRIAAYVHVMITTIIQQQKPDEDPPT